MSENVEQGERPAGPAGIVDPICEAVTRLCLAIAAAALLCIVVVNGANVIGRYFFRRPLSWAEELMLFLMILSVFSGGIAITWRNMHIRIDTLVERTSPLTQLIIRVFTVGVSIVVLLTIVGASYGVVAQLYSFDFRTDALSAPMWIPQAFVTVGLTLMAVMMAVRLITSLIASRSGAAARGQHKERSMTALILAVLSAVLLVLGVPIFIVLLTAAVIGVWMTGNPIQAVHSAMFGSLDIVPLLAVPLFIYAGDVMSRGGMARRLIEFVLSIFGAVRGSLGIATIAACELFSVLSGLGRRLRRRDRQAHDPGAQAERLRRALLGQPGHRDRRNRHHHPAVDHHDHLRHRRAAVGAATVPGRIRARAS